MMRVISFLYFLVAWPQFLLTDLVQVLKKRDFLMNAVKNLVKLSLGFEQKGNGKMIGVLRKEKAAWLDKVPSGLRGKPDNNPFG